jgi:hypothetical protein
VKGGGRSCGRGSRRVELAASPGGSHRNVDRPAVAPSPTTRRCRSALPLFPSERVAGRPVDRRGKAASARSTAQLTFIAVCHSPPSAQSPAMSRRTLGTTLASILLPPGHAARPSRDASEDSDAPRPLTALAVRRLARAHLSRASARLTRHPRTRLQALIQEREALAKKRTIASVSWLPDVIVRELEPACLSCRRRRRHRRLVQKRF